MIFLDVWRLLPVTVLVEVADHLVSPGTPGACDLSPIDDVAILIAHEDQGLIDPRAARAALGVRDHQVLAVSHHDMRLEDDVLC